MSNNAKDIDDGAMWGYWRGKYGYVEALEHYCPKSLADEPRLSLARAQIQNAQASIDAFFADKVGGEI